jgi:glycerophosphoryl diester phosphodiesterase
MKRTTYLVFPLLCLVACHSSKMSTTTASSSMQLPAFNKEGHRGTRGLMPENTIPSMYKAIDYDVNTVEVDIVFSKDKQVVISHDVYFHPDITTTPDGKQLNSKEAQALLLYEMDYADIKKYDVGMKPHKDFPQQLKIPAYKPLLGELIDSTNWYAQKKGRKVLFNIELKTNPAHDGSKTPPVEEFVDRTMEVVKDKKIEQQCYLQSFDFRPLQILHKKYPHIVTAVLISGSDKRTLAQHLDELGYTPEMYSPHYSLVNEALVTECHKRNIKLIPWTVNTVEEMKKMKALGVDGIITDYPNYFEQLGPSKSPLRGRLPDHETRGRSQYISD